MLTPADTSKLLALMATARTVTNLVIAEMPRDALNDLPPNTALLPGVVQATVERTVARCVTELLAALTNLKVLKVVSHENGYHSLADEDGDDSLVPDWSGGGIEVIELNEKDVSSVYPVWPPGVDWLTEDEDDGWGISFSDYESTYFRTGCNVKF